MILAAALLFLLAANQASTTAPKRCASAAAAATADAFAAKFDDHQLIFIGSTHGDRKIEEFLMCLVTRPAFQQRATDIVVESASAAHQGLLDRYVLALDQIARDDLAPIWLDTDHPTMWATLPQVRQFVETLRDYAGPIQRPRPMVPHTPE